MTAGRIAASARNLGRFLTAGFYLLLWPVVGACDATPTPDLDANSNPDAGPTASSQDAASADGRTDATTGTTRDAGTDAGEDCSGDTLCFDIRRVGPAQDGRVFLVWFIIAEGFDSLFGDRVTMRPAPEVGFEMPVAATEERLRIPLADVQPPSDPLLICERASTTPCESPSDCPCTGSVRFAIGGIFLMYEDGGVTPFPAIRGDGLYADGSDRNQANGTAPLVMTYSVDDFGPRERINDIEVGGLTPQGLKSGVHPNTIIDGPFEDIVPTEIRLFELRACSAIDNTACRVNIHFT